MKMKFLAPIGIAKKENFVVVWVYFDWDEWIFAVVSNQWIFGLV